MNRSVSRLWWIAATLALLSASAAAYLMLRGKPAPRLTLMSARHDQLDGWRDDRHAAALPALLRSCAAILGKAQGASFDLKTRGTDFGTAGEWRAPCAAASAVPAGDDQAARRFLEVEFVPFLAGNNGDSEGLFTAISRCR